MEIMKVWINKTNKQRLITIPKDSKIIEGEYVAIIRIKNMKDMKIKQGDIQVQKD